jgi:glycerophosphoryl diester phosphodiesterase
VGSFYLDRPLNFAHRGASHAAPENTLAAFLLAVEMGADGVEFDVQLSKDGEVVVIHDFVLETTTDGRGAVRDHTLGELKALDAGSRFSAEFAAERIPTLQEVVDAVGDALLLNIELKTASWRDDGLAAAVGRLIVDRGLEERVVVSSFSPLAVQWMRRHQPVVPRGLLYAPDSPWFLRRPWARLLLRPDALHPYYTMVDEGMMAWARARGYHVNVWTVDEVDAMRELIELGADGIITNRPDRLAQVLGFGAKP